MLPIWPLVTNLGLYRLSAMQQGHNTQNLELGDLVEHVIEHSGLLAFHKNEKGEKTPLQRQTNNYFWFTQY